MAILVLAGSSGIYMDHKLHEHPLFTIRHELLSPEDRIRVNYERARLIIQTWNLTPEEISSCSTRFWEHQQDPGFAVDPAVANIVTCSINLFIGTLYPLLSGRPHLKPLIEQAQRGEIFGNLFLSELGHGLDILNLETTATKVADGFLLNTPRDSATKFMAPTLPIDGIPRWGIVMSRLFVDDEDRGIHPFLIQTSNEHGMCPGVSNTCLPIRSGSMLDYSLTTFNNVHLPSNAFLGKSLERPKDRRALLHAYIWRIPVGTAAIGMPAIVSSKMLACIAADYSLRRHVQGSRSDRVPILSFRTQALPVLYGMAIAHVLSAWMPNVIEYYTAKGTTFEMLIAMGAVMKTTAHRMIAQATHELGERLGAQGLFPQNHLGVLETDLRGTSIAEGDVLALSIRLYTEILLERQKLPIPAHRDTLLYKRYLTHISTNTLLMNTFPEGHRDDRFNDIILPQCEQGIRALGNSLAYSAAIDAGVSAPLLELFEMACVKSDVGWFSEHAGLTEAVRMRKEDEAVRAALPNLRKYADDLQIRKSVPSPIMSDEKWRRWLEDLKVQNQSFAGGLLRRSVRLEETLAKL